MTITDLECPGQARALNVAGAAQRNGGVGRLTRGRKERLGIDGLTRTARAPGRVDTTFRNTRNCFKSGYCGMGCPVDAKQSMLVTYLPDAVQKGATVVARAPCS